MKDGDNALLTYYINYLKYVRNLSDSSVAHYTQALRKISTFLCERGKITESVYEILDIGELEIIKEYLYSDEEFMILDKRGHQMYSAGLNNYYKFASGDGFGQLHERVQELDTKLMPKESSCRSVVSRPRSSIIKMQSIESAAYTCELFPEHKSFVAKNTEKPYMEGHHALPLSLQPRFRYSLDIYANIICLCPICHKMMHYGLDSEKSKAIDKIYYDRADRLANSGIVLSKDDFKKMVI